MLYTLLWGVFIMETKKERLKRLIRDEMNTIEILRNKKKDIERQIDSNGMITSIVYNVPSI